MEKKRGGGKSKRRVKLRDDKSSHRKTDELFVNNGVTSIYLWPPSPKGIYNDNRRRLDKR